jgi:hypothetical protein
LRVRRYVKRHVYDTMTTAAQYRQYAEECLEARRAAMIPEVRAALSIAAQRWIALADQRDEEEDEAASASDRRAQSDGASAPAGT